MSSTLKNRLKTLENKQPSKILDSDVPPGVEVVGFEWTHPDPKICASLPKRGYCGIKAKIYMWNPAEGIEVFDGKSNLKLVKCGWCSHFAKDCSGANYWKFDLPSIRAAQTSC